MSKGVEFVKKECDIANCANNPKKCKVCKRQNNPIRDPRMLRDWYHPRISIELDSVEEKGENMEALDKAISDLKEEFDKAIRNLEETFGNSPVEPKTGMLFEWAGECGDNKANPVMYHETLGLISLKYPERFWDYVNNNYPGSEITYMETWIKQGELKRLPSDYEYTIKQGEDL